MCMRGIHDKLQNQVFSTAMVRISTPGLMCPQPRSETYLQPRDCRSLFFRSQAMNVVSKLRTLRSKGHPQYQCCQAVDQKLPLETNKESHQKPKEDGLYAKSRHRHLGGGGGQVLVPLSSIPELDAEAEGLQQQCQDWERLWRQKRRDHPLLAFFDSHELFSMVVLCSGHPLRRSVIEAMRNVQWPKEEEEEKKQLFPLRFETSLFLPTQEPHEESGSLKHTRRR